jgi:hypothetical protein
MDKTETEIKLEDAATQLQLAIDNMTNEGVFRSCINSFISFARSVTMVMERESSHNQELLNWYKSKTAQFATIPVMRFFVEQRNITIHRGNVRPTAQSIPLRNITGVETGEQPMMAIWVFDNVQDYVSGETGNVFRLCSQYLQTLSEMVNEWVYRKAVIETPGEVIEELQAGLGKLRGQILWMRGELTNARHTMELLNDILKRKGDSSHDDWVSELVIRIDRVITPEKFLSGSAISPMHRGDNVSANNTGTLMVNTILLSPTEADESGAEGVYATIRNDYARDKSGKPIFDKEFGFVMLGVQLKGPVAAEKRGFSTAKEAEDAAHWYYKMLRY